MALYIISLRASKKIHISKITQRSNNQLKRGAYKIVPFHNNYRLIRLVIVSSAINTNKESIVRKSINMDFG